MTLHSSSVPRFPRRPGVTLIEIMIVVVILVLVASVAIPAIRFNFEDKKVRETARQLNAYFAGAKAQAAERNRQVAVWLERTPGNLNQCIAVYSAEVPLPYSGDWYDARSYVRKNHNLNAAIVGSQWEVVFESSPTLKCGMLTHSHALVAPNDTFLIRFNYKGAVYLVKRVALTAGQPPQNDLFVFQNPIPSPMPIPGCWLPYDSNGMGGWNFSLTGWGRTGFDDDGDGFIDEADEQGAPVTANPPPLDASDFPVGLAFQVYLNPKRTSAAPLDLANDVAIDLSWSGMGASGTDFDSWKGTAPITPDASPVIVVFTPGGQVERIYHNGSFTIPNGTVHFLIGRPETIQPLTAGVPNPAVNPRDGVDLNMQDQSHLWISITPQNGNVTTAENFYDPAQYTVDVCRTYARSGQAKGGG